ncbi:MAG TPA: helicase-related protein, partial [Tepidisphaeraceae bacterium]|nr:helicase-related protein [Tepidisphaeraceae bacterium]
HLLAQIKEKVDGGGRVLVTTLTKRLAEDLSAYIQEAGIKGRYLHSEIQTIERVEILTDLRKGDFDVLIGINLLREGLDLPEVNMVAILDADKAGFLRSETSLIQTIGRAARNAGSKVILYADSTTPAMQRAMDETARRRALQTEYNAKHGITPTTVQKAIRTSIESEVKARRTVAQAVKSNEQEMDQSEIIKLLEEEMLEAARNLEFERAAQLRDKLNEMKGAPTIKSGGEMLNADGETQAEANKIWQPKSKGRGGKRRVAK